MRSEAGLTQSRIVEQLRLLAVELNVDPRRLLEAWWQGDVDYLQEVAGCRCCCFEHTFGLGCPAYAWGGCRGQGSVEQDHRSWFRFYQESRGFTEDQFYGA